MIVSLALAVIAIVAGGYGLFQIAFQQGYVEGYEDATHPDDVIFKEE